MGMKRLDYYLETGVKVDYHPSNHWWTDSYAHEDYWNHCAGAYSQFQVREQVMKDWTERWSWLKGRK